MQKQVIKRGELVADFQSIDSIRERVIKELGEVSHAEPALAWG
jgi:hypothetical protein